MKKLVVVLFTLGLVVLAVESWAGPVEEVAQVAAPRGKVFEEGTPEAYVAAFADNAVLTAALSPFRIEGKEAIRSYFVELFQLYPGRRLFTRQPAARAYGDDLVVQNGYFVVHFTDQKGQVTQFSFRSSVVWTKVSGRWQIADQHVSRVPVMH
jgi:uncharacterized protein (TIGR02246 family)